MSKKREARYLLLTTALVTGLAGFTVLIFVPVLTGLKQNLTDIYTKSQSDYVNCLCSPWASEACLVLSKNSLMPCLLLTKLVKYSVCLVIGQAGGAVWM